MSGDKKSKKLPAMPWYWGDWRRDINVQSLEPIERYAWFEIIGMMWDSQERGVLVAGGQPIPDEIVARMVDSVLLSDNRIGYPLICKLLERGVMSRRESDGALYCRRMVDDERRRKQNALNGSKGGNPSLRLTDGITENWGNGLTETDNPQVIRLSENENENENTKKGGCGGKRKRFRKPTVEEVADYCRERGNGIDPQRFFDYYESNGWVQGKGKSIKDWRACVRTWERNTSKSSRSEMPF